MTPETSQALSECIDATQVDGMPHIIELIPHRTYRIDEAISRTLSRPLEIRGNGATIVSSLPFPLQFLAKEHKQLTLVADVAYGSREILVADASSVSIGDIISLESDVSISSAWPHYRPHDVRRVVSVSGNTIMLDSPVNLAYVLDTEAVTAKHFANASIVIRDLTIDNQCPGSGACLRMWALGARVENVRLVTNGEGHKDGLWLYYCVNVIVSNVRIQGPHYGIPIYASRFVRLEGVQCEKAVGHPTPIGQCSSHITIDGLVVQDSPGAIDAHPSFHVTYRNVIADRSAFNMRAWGMRIENATFENALPQKATTLLSVQLPPEAQRRFPHLLTDYNLDLINLRYRTADNSPMVVLIHTNFGSVFIDRCELPSVMVEVMPVYSMRISNSRIGHFHQRSFNGPQHASEISLSNVVIDGRMSATKDAMRIYIGPQRAVLNNVRCINNDVSGTLFGIATFKDLTCINCDFGEWSEFMSVWNNVRVPTTGYRFTNCHLVIRRDELMQADFKRFTDCTGAIEGRPFK